MTWTVRSKLAVALVATLSCALLVVAPTQAASPTQSIAATQAAGAAVPAPQPCKTAAGPCWHPPTASPWQYQLQGSVDGSGACIYPSTGFINTNITGVSFATGKTVAPTVFDIDYYQDGRCFTPNRYNVLNSPAVRALHARAGRVIGYVNAGSAESWRPDYGQYQSFDSSCGHCLIGKPVSGFPNEFWLNINADKMGVNPSTGKSETQRHFIIDQLTARLKKVRSISADAIEFDNVDAYQNTTGFAISANTQLTFNALIANLAHSMGFTVGLKNDLGQLTNLKPYFDFAINEQCFEFSECDFPPPGLPGWSASGKAVFQVEYNIAPSQFCAKADGSWNFNSIKKTVDLYDQPYGPCR